MYFDVFLFLLPCLLVNKDYHRHIFMIHNVYIWNVANDNRNCNSILYMTLRTATQETEESQRHSQIQSET